MAGFPVENRYLTKGSSILLDEWQITKTISLEGPLKAAFCS